MKGLGWSPIVNQCQNPSCLRAYERGTGEIYVFEEDLPGTCCLARTNTMIPVWLCDNCNGRYTVLYDIYEKLVSVVPRTQSTMTQSTTA